VAKRMQSTAASLPDAERALAFFTPVEASAVEAATGRIFPSDDLGSGAIEAGVLFYLDRALAGAEIQLQGLYRTGLRKLDAEARAKFDNAFSECTSSQQDNLIAAMESDDLSDFGRAPTGPEFFALLRAHTIEGMFSDPVHGGNRDLVGWRLLGYPGPQPSYSHAEQQLDAVIVRERIFTAADYPLADAEGDAT
jgi:gluconate 2-dehydrogenase gamma chain